MQAVILAAGRGNRLKPFTDNMPKTLLKIKDKTIIEQNLNKLPAEIKEVIIVIGYLGKQIKDFIGDNYKGKRIIYVKQNNLLGSAHALSLCKNFLKDRYLVLMGDDIYTKKDIEKCLKHKRCMLVYEQKNLFTGNNIIVKNNIFVGLKKIVNKKNALVNTGLYVLDKKFFDFDLVKIENNEEFGLPHTLADITKKYPIEIEKTKKWIQINTVDDLLSLTKKNGELSVEN